MTRTRPTNGTTPELDAGLAVLRQSAGRPAGLQTLATDALARIHRRERDRDGEAGNPGEGGGRSDDAAFWIDARNAASTYALYELAPERRALDRLRVARAFTAYQHHSLVERVAARATASTPLIVAPNVASLYRDDDVPDWESEALCRSAARTLDELGRRLEVPVLASVGRDDGLAEIVREAADAEIECRETAEGFYYSVGEFRTTVYWSAGYWQTTIPYWVDLLGAVDEPAPAIAAHDRGLVADA